MKKIRIITTLLLACSALFACGQKASPELLTPDNHVLVFVDHESQMAFPVKSIGIEELRNNTALLAGGSKIFKVPVVITTVNEKSFSGPVFPEIQEVYPKGTSNYLDRSTMNAWEDGPAYKAITEKGKKKIVFAGLWTSVCIAGPVLSAITDGYDVYFVTDACGDVSREAHDMSIMRMIQAGAKPLTSTQYVLELQRDWGRSATYPAVTGLFKKYGGAYGIGIQYAGEVLKH
jgi:nicotinamidase-related amidase